MSAVVHGGSMILFGGGVIQNYYDDIYRIDLDNRVWTRLRPLGSDLVPRTLSHTAVVHDGRMLVFGGMARDACHNECYVLPLDHRPLAWGRLSTSRPPTPRKGHQACVWRSRMYIFLGADFQGYTMEDVHWLDLRTREWHAVTRTPGAPWPKSRTGHSVAVHQRTNTLYLFGGMRKVPSAEDGLISTSEWLSDLWEFSFLTNSWKQVEPLGGPRPAGRYSQISWVAGDSMLVFGGDAHECSEYFGDLWQFSLEQRTWRRLDVAGDRPSPRSGHVGVSWRGCLYMFGGEKPLRSSNRDGDRGQDVVYSNSLYQMPHFIERNTSLKAIVARHLLSESLLSGGNRELFAKGCRHHRLPDALVKYLDSVRPRGRRRQLRQSGVAPWTATPTCLREIGGEDRYDSETSASASDSNSLCGEDPLPSSLPEAAE